MKYSTALTLAAISSLLTACGGSGNDTSSGSGSFSLGVSDNPANVNGVTIAFNQVVLKGVNGTTGTFSLDVASGGQPSQVDLLTVTGSAIEPLITGQTIPTGDYQLCIYMLNDETGAAGTSFVETNTPSVEGLTTNSNGSCGGTGATDPATGRLFFNQSFTIASGNNNFVAEFNLEKGLLSPRGSNTFWTLKPTSVQLVNTTEVGAISGTLSTTLVDDCHAAAGTAGAVTFADRVYLYPGAAGVDDPQADPAIKSMVDFRASADVAATQVAPIAAARAEPVTDGGSTVTGYSYELGFVVAGEYSLGFTCLAQNDDADTVDQAADSEPFFLTDAAGPITVSADATTTQNLPAN